jgi:hypothetical protein
VALSVPPHGGGCGIQRTNPLDQGSAREPDPEGNERIPHRPDDLAASGVKVVDEGRLPSVIRRRKRDLRQPVRMERVQDRWRQAARRGFELVVAPASPVVHGAPYGEDRQT